MATTSFGITYLIWAYVSTISTTSFATCLVFFYGIQVAPISMSTILTCSIVGIPNWDVVLIGSWFLKESLI
jgi:hypothetical protein